MTTAPTRSPGFISAEVFAPTSEAAHEWKIAQHFRNADQMKAWGTSQACRSVLEEAKALTDPADSKALREEQVIDSPTSVATEVVTTYVKPCKNREYEEWAEKIHRAEAQFPGYRGGLLQPPAGGQQHHWTKLVRFATPELLDAWLNSDVRHGLLREHDALVKSWVHHRLPTAFGAWFPPDSATGDSSSSWKQSLLVVLMLFPIVMLEMKFLGPALSGMSRSPATFISNVIGVFLLAWPFMPMIIAVMKWWLLPPKDAPGWITPAGVGLLVTLYAVEIVGFSHLL